MRFKDLILRDLFKRSFARFAEREAVCAKGVTLSFGELWNQASALAAKLQADGIGPGDKVVFLLRNSTDYVVSDLAVILAGACKVPLNDMLAADDVGYMINHCGANAVIAHSSFHETIGQIEDALAKVSLKIVVADDENILADFSSLGLFKDRAEFDFESVRVKPSDPGLIIYTGGTTGRPKGVYHTQESLAVNFLSHLINAQIQTDEHLLICSPLPHSAQQFVLSALLQGAKITIEQGYDADRVAQLIETEKLTWMFMVPTMIYRLLDLPNLSDRDLSSLRTVVYGASPITPARLQQGLDLLGPIFLQIYGQTEIPNLVTTLSKSDHLTPDLLTSCGQPVIFCDVIIRGEEGGELPTGEVGEITVRSFYTLEHYHANPEVTKSSYIGDYLKTGDIGYKSMSGHVFLVDRAKDMIISGGMNVYSTEVENVIQEVNGVGQVVVIGVPDDDWGEAVTAFVISSDSAPSPEDVTSYCKQKLAKYKIPKRVELVEEIPLTPYGKPDKKALRARFWKDQARQIG